VIHEVGRGRKILLTGRPGIGKTTVITRTVDRLKYLTPAGFYTEEIRERGQRRGFRATALGGYTITMAHVDIEGQPRIGRYGVDLKAFDALIAEELARPADLVVIDEIGKMECFSSRFVAMVRNLFDGPTRVLGTAAISGGGFIAEVKKRPDVELWEVTHANRDELPQRLANALLRSAL
jgi:nucleoside-triphosphatase